MIILVCNDVLMGAQIAAEMRDTNIVIVAENKPVVKEPSCHIADIIIEQLNEARISCSCLSLFEENTVKRPFPVRVAKYRNPPTNKHLRKNPVNRGK